MFSVFGLIDWISLFLVSNYKVSLLLFFISISAFFCRESNMPSRLFSPM